MASNTSLVLNGKPLLGQQFHMVVYRDFNAGKGFGAQQVTYHWEDGKYVRDSATTANVVRFVAEPLEENDFLLERSQAERANATSNIYTYWIARKVTNGTYLIFPIDEQDMKPADRSVICVNDAPEGFCSVKNHDQVVTAARATAIMPFRSPAVGILVDDGGRKDASIQLVKEKQ